MILLSLLLSLVSVSSESMADVRVAVASNFLAPLQQIGRAFTLETGTQVEISSGASGKFFAQIENGAPFDIFLSADQSYPKTLIEKKLAKLGSSFTYAIGSLVLWSADPKLIDADGKVLKELKFKHLAIANPKLAPYGIAAEEALKKMGMIEKVRPLLVMGENVAQTHQFIVSGNAELGLIPLSEALPEKNGSQWIVPRELYSPIRQDAVILSKAKNVADVKKFFEYLKGKESKAIIKNFGYTLP